MASGYGIVKQFSKLYTQFLDRWPDGHPQIPVPIYGIPHPRRPEPIGIPQYHGIDRQPLHALTFEQAEWFRRNGCECRATTATTVLDEIEVATGREDGWVTDAADIRRVWAALGHEQGEHEIIFAKEHNDPAVPSPYARFLGCDVAYFVRDHFSCVCDALFIPRWHGTDSEGTLFRHHFDMLNANGLFGDTTAALNYLRYYLSFDWTERADNFTSIEVYAVEPAAP